MAKEISLLFPGQGSQFTGMLTQDLISSYKDIIEEASDLLEIDFISLINDESDNKLNQTSYTQPALLLTSYLTFLRFQTLTNIKPIIMAGHSLGEYSALVASNSIDFYDALKIVRKRGLLMEAAPSGLMAAIMGIDSNILRAICMKEDGINNKVVSCANLNSPLQTVIAGSDSSVKNVCNLAKEAGAKRTIILNVSVASHCKLMDESSKLFAKYLEDINIDMPSSKVIHNFSAKAADDPIIIKQNLINQLTNSVKWVDTMNEIASTNSIVIECGPGKVLQGLAKSNGISDILSLGTKDFDSKLKELLWIK